MVVAFLLAGNGDYSTVHSFLSTIFCELETDNAIIFGSDQEKAFRKAIKRVFPNCDRIACYKHLKDNASTYLKDKTGIKKIDRKSVLDMIFGEKKGIIYASNIEDFEKRKKEALKLIENKCPTFTNHFLKDIIPILLENCETCWKYSWIKRNWCNNNCESLNHVLKMRVDWRPRDLLDLINNLEAVVRSQITDLKRSLRKKGNFRLQEQFKKFETGRWLSEVELEKKFKKFLKTPVLQDPKQKVGSSDGRLWIYPSLLGGKKPNQTTGKRSNRTRSFGRRVRAKTEKRDSESELTE